MQLDAGPGFTGHATDVATGLTYMQQRYYDADIGRLISPDPVGPEEDFIKHFNRYNYAQNNPVRYTDPDGRAVNFIIKAGIDFSIEVGIQYLTTGSVDFGDAAYETGKGLLNPLKTLERGRDLARIVKGADKVKDTVSASKKLHGNDRRNPNAQHNYDILDKNGRVRKNGVGSGSADNGRSTRAEKQLEDGDSYRITDRHSEGPGARGRAYDKEKERAREHYQNLEPMDRHERPKP